MNHRNEGFRLQLSLFLYSLISPWLSGTNIQSDRVRLIGLFQRGRLHNRHYMGISPNRGKGKIIGFGGKVKFRWNLNEAVFLWAQNKAELCVMESKSGVDFKVDPKSCCLGNYKVNIYEECCAQKPLIWSSASAPCLEIKPASLCQGDLDPPCKSGMFLSYWYMFIQPSFWYLWL